MFHPRLIHICLMILLAASSAGAQETVKMTVAECRKMALDNNPDIALAERDRMGAELLHEAAHGIFDTLVNASLFASDEDSPSASQLAGADVLESESLRAQGSATQLLPWGARADITLGTSRFESNNEFQTVNPSFSSSLGLGLTQPLLRGLGKDVTFYEVRQTKLGEDQASDRVALTLMLQLQEVENTYWDLVISISEVVVVKQSLRVADDLLSQNKIRVEVGTLAPIELVQAEAGVALRQEAIIIAEASVRNNEEALKRLMGVPPGDPLWDKVIEPTGEPEPSQLPATLDEARRLAGEKRPELALAKSDVQSKEMTVELRSNQAKPTLDLRATYGSAGLGGDTLLFDENGNVIGSASGGAGDSLEQAFGFDFPVWTLGLTFAHPIRNRAGHAALAGARIEQEKSAINLRKSEINVDTDVRVAFRAVDTARKSLEASRATERAEAKKLEAEQKKFENGLSTSFQVLDFDEDLARARSQLRKAEINVQKAIVNLERATGTLLERRNISVAR